MPVIKFTPTLMFGGEDTGIVYVNNTGVYSVLDDEIFCQIDITLASKGSATGVAHIYGLPFVAIEEVDGEVKASNVLNPDEFPLAVKTQPNSHVLRLVYIRGAEPTIIDWTEKDFFENSKLQVKVHYKHKN